MATDSTTDVPELPPRRSILGIVLPVGLFVWTCYSTYQTPNGLPYAFAIMTTLLAHELGHFVQTRRYGVPSTLPLFIPMPSIIGTMGAVILMKPGKGDRRAIFDIAITGPLAGLVFALIFSIIGLEMSQVVSGEPSGGLRLGEPLLFKALGYLTFGPLGPTQEIMLHPIAFGGWVGIFITAINLFPIGQLDGGHILYALLRKKAHLVAQLILVSAILAVIFTHNWGWSVMLALLLFMGPNHPPTANDDVPLGTARTVLGWASLLFVIIGFTPTPFIF